MSTDKEDGPSLSDIAVVGMSAHFPGAPDARQYWKNLRAGVESVQAFTPDELLAAGVAKDELAHPRYVKSGVVLEGMEHFDAEFFGFSPKEAAILDPQHRHFLECAWEALEDAGHVPERFDGTVGVFGGCGMGAYFMFNLLSNPELVKSVGLFLLRHTGNDKDFLATRVAYLFDLKGPVVSVQTACSTSLVAVHMAAQSLLSGECDMALAGGVTIEVPHRRGYVFEEGEILSPDGHCRAFDARSAGTIFGSGAGVVVLRRLEDALADGDHVYAVIKGTAINNDGSGKVGYLAPSVDGQAAAIAEAISVAGVRADSIAYVETHGTGTAMGDPIEIAALTQAFRRDTPKNGFCGIGSVKTNIGHLDTAAGVASLIKVALALEAGELPPSLNWSAPNPAIDFATTPFHVVTAATPWPRGATPRRAGVNSLGVGGTNAHAIVEEAPRLPAPEPSKRPVQPLVLSARNRAALDAAQRRLAQHLREHSAGRPGDLADVAWTLFHGRRAFAERRVLACHDIAEAIALLEGGDTRRVQSQVRVAERPTVAFLLPGGGAQHVRMGRELMRLEPEFRRSMERGLALLRAREGLDLAPLLAAEGDALAAAEAELERPSRQLPAIFLVEYALAQLWKAWGVEPTALLGHSLGENTAACLAGVFSLEDALGLVSLRGRLFEKAPAGAMLSVPLSAKELAPLLGTDLDLAVINAPELSVVSGPPAAIEALQRMLAEREIEAQRIAITTAAHSRLVEPVLEEFRAFLRRLRLAPPRIPFLSNTTGTWITPEQATSPDYWVDHLRHTVRFDAGARALLEDPARILIEVGPGRTLASLTRQNVPAARGTGAPASSVAPALPATVDRCIVSSLPHPDDPAGEAAHFATTLARVWAAGAPVKLERWWEGERRRRVPLPAYAFQRQRYWIEPGKAAYAATSAEPAEIARIGRIDDWFFEPIWKRSAAAGASASASELRASSNGTVSHPEKRPEVLLVFADRAGVGDAMAERRRAAGGRVLLVRPGDNYAHPSPDEFRLAPEQGRGAYDALVRDLVAEGASPTRILHLWMLTADERARPGSSFFHQNQERGYYSLLFLAQAMSAEGAATPVHVDVVSNGMQRVGDEELAYPDKATLLGPVRVIPREYPGITCASIDLAVARPSPYALTPRALSKRVLAGISTALDTELARPPANTTVAWRAGERFVESMEAAPRAGADGRPVALREHGTYLITGGLGGMALALAEELARSVRARLVLLARTPLPAREDWTAWIAARAADDPMRKRLEGVQGLEALGAEVLVLRADVTDVEDVRAALETAHERFGALHGVIHAAGVVQDQLIQSHTQTASEDVFAPKLHGTHVLAALLAGTPLDFFLLCSSTSVVTAPPGQVDYVAANAYLNAFAERRAHAHGGLTVAIGWGVWAEVGMAAEAVSGARNAHPRAVPLENGRAHPLLDARVEHAGDDELFLAHFSCERLWVVSEHRTAQGHALLPGTGYLELAAAALRASGESGPFELTDLYFFRPLHVPDGETRAVRVRLRTSDAGYELAVQSSVEVTNGTSGWQTHATATVRLHALQRPAAVDRAAIAARCNAGGLPADERGIRTAQEAFLRFGPRWRVLREARFGKDEGLARLELQDEFRGDVGRFALHPALLDLATTFLLPLVSPASPSADRVGLWVPLSYGRVRVHGLLPARVWSHARVVERDAANGLARFDLTLTDESGRIVVEIESFAMRRVADPSEFVLVRPPAANELERDPDTTGAHAHATSPAELALRRNVEQGIRPAEGVEVLRRVLAGGKSGRVVVSSLDLDRLAREAGALAAPSAAGGPRFERPALASEYVAPRDDIERTLAGFWEELLGVGQVGVNDSFFDLGGHSLIAVRLFARIKKTWHVEYPISVLFEAPTVARCAELLRPRVQASGAGSEKSKAQAERRYAHLVAMHAGKKGRKTPFFLVAGMFGNVLNLRHLAHLVGTDRPMYGLQARGLYGEEAPHENFEEMAKDYLAEMRTVQARGPWILGGFSGGGITAYEIARVLLEAGEEVEALVLLDTPLPRTPTISRADKAVIHWQRFKRRGPAYMTDWAGEKLRWKLARMREQRAPTAEVSAADFRSSDIEAAFRRALERYQLRPLPLNVSLFRPKLQIAHRLSGGRVTNPWRDLVFHDNGWTPIVKHVDVHEVPGDHDSMVLEPNVRVLATRLRRMLEALETSRAAHSGAG